MHLKALLLTAAFAAGSFAPADAQCVANPFGGFAESGQVGTRAVTVILNYSGGNGEAFDATAYWLMAGPNGSQLAHFSVEAENSGDRMAVYFARNKMLVTNAIYLPGEAHCCYTHLAVQRFGMTNDPRRPQLVREAVETVAIPKSPDFAADECPANQIDKKVKDWFDGPYRSAIISAGFAA